MRGLRRLGPYVRRYRGHLVAGVLSIFLAAIVGLLTPIVVGDAVDALSGDFSRRRLLGYAGLVVGLTAIRGLFNFGQRRILVAMSRHIEFDLRNDFFAHLERLSGSFFQTSYTGDLMARATNDLQAVRMVCGPAIMYGSNTIFSGVGALVLMWRIDGKLTLLALFTLPFVALATQYFGQRIHRLFEKVQEQFSELSTRAQESFAGVRVVRAYAQEAAEEEGFAAANREYVARNRHLIAWTAAFHPLLQALIGLGFVAVLWYGGLQVYRGAITVGEFVAFNLFLSKLAWPMIAIGWVINLVQRGSASLERIARVLREQPAVEDRPGARAIDVEGRIRFRALDFAYDPEAGAALKGIDCAVEAGQTVGVIGRTGSGKTTLLSLLPRLFEPPPGSVEIDGVDVLDLELQSLRGAIGFVPQETFLFSASIRDNIALGRPEADDDEITRAAGAAGLGDDLAAFPQGLETMVGERGITLSGGQKQRVALARALIREPRILLLDDCLSAVDTATEEAILGHLETARRGRTVFIVSHRISTIRRADLILVLEDGEVVARGRHAELVAQGGLYADLFYRQQLEAELAAV